MPGLVPGIHVLTSLSQERRGERSPDERSDIRGLLIGQHSRISLRSCGLPLRTLIWEPVLSNRVDCKKRRQVICPSGFDHENLSSPFCKNILFFRIPKSVYILRHPVPKEGRWPSSRTLGRDAVDAAASGMTRDRRADFGL